MVAIAKRIGWFLAVAALLGGCGGTRGDTAAGPADAWIGEGTAADSAVGDGNVVDPEAATVESYLEASCRAAIQKNAACCGPSLWAMQCDPEKVRLDLLIASQRSLVASGQMVYDRGCGAAILALLKRMTCADMSSFGGDMFSPSELAAQLVPSSCPRGPLYGTQGAGAVCGVKMQQGEATVIRISDVCDNGLVCDQTPQVPVCAPPIPPGGTCVASERPCVHTHQCQRGVCVPKLAEGAACTPWEQCAPGLKCHDENKVCVRPAWSSSC